MTVAGLFLEQPEDHIPQQPSWNCGTCGNEWPCAYARADLIAESIAGRTSVLVYVKMCLADAVADLARPLRQVRRLGHCQSRPSVNHRNGRSQLAMMRDELLQRITALPSDSDVGVQIGDDHLDITEVVPFGDGTFGALRCHSRDLRDMLVAWELPRDLRDRLAPGDTPESTEGHDAG
jgi:hypothetical protein